MGKGVLLELDGRQAVVLTPQGEFKRVPVPKGSWDIGEEIEYAEVSATPWAKWGLAAAAAAVMLLAPVGVTSVINAQPQAVVTVDINPSIQLVINRHDQVLDALGVNQDGQDILAGVDWKRQPVDEVVAELTDRAVAAHKLNVSDEASAVVVAVAPAKGDDLPKEQADRIRDKAWSAVNTVVREEAQKANTEAKTNVAALEALAAEKAEAEQVGLTVGKFLIYKELQAQGLAVQPADLQTMGPGKLLHNLNVLPADVFNQAQTEHGGQPKEHGNVNKKGDDQSEPAATQPANNKPDDKGNGDKKDDPGKSGSAPGQSGKSGSGGNQTGSPAVQPGNSGKPQGGGSQSDKKQSDDKKSDDKKSNDKDTQEKNEGKKGAWTVPLLGITIEKPAFLKDKESAEPRAEQPGERAPASEQQREQDKQQQENAREQEKQQKEQQKEQGKGTENKGQDKKDN